MIEEYKGVRIFIDFIDNGNGDLGVFRYRIQNENYYYENLEDLKLYIDLKISRQEEGR